MAADLISRLETLDCHFNWRMSIEEISKETAVDSAFQSIRNYNKYIERPVKRYAMCLNGAYIAFIIGKGETRKKLLFIANQILEHCRDPSSPQPPSKLISDPFDPLWELPFEQFLEKCEKYNTNDTEDEEEDHANDGGHSSGDPDDDDELSDVPKLLPEEDEEGTFKLWNEDRFTGMYTGATYVVLSLEAIMRFREGAPSKEVEDLLALIPPVSQMSASECAIIRYIEANSWRLTLICNMFMPAYGAALQADPTDMKWYLLLLKVLNTIRTRRRRNWGRKVEWEDVVAMLDASDLVLGLKPAPWIVVHLNFEKLQAINDYMVCSKRTLPYAESQRLFQLCLSLCNKVIENTTQTECLAYCAQILSRRPHTMDLAVSTIEKALAVTVDYDRAYVNSKASNIFANAKRLEEALVCAETAAPEAFGSNWQVLELKTLLGYEIDPVEFFKNVRSKCERPRHIEQLHIGAFLYYICKTKAVDSAIMRVQKVMKCASISTSKGIMGDIYCKWIQEDVNVAEAAYNVVLYVLNGDYKDDDIELTNETVEVCQKLKDALEKDHLKDRALGRLTPKEYVLWLRGSKNRQRNQNARVNTGYRGGSSFLQHQKYTKEMKLPSRGGSNIHRGNSNRNETKPEVLSWRNEMRSTTENDTKQTIQTYPGSPSDCNQPAASWVSPWHNRSSDETQTKNTSQRSRDHKRNPQEKNNQITGGCSSQKFYPNWRTHNQ